MQRFLRLVTPPMPSRSPRRGRRCRSSDFMAAALYDPRFGYYTANIKTVGRSATSRPLPPCMARSARRSPAGRGPRRSATGRRS
ncbi:MAG: hypothetical protein R3F11_32255 [Verrucomicrobiales bacterium]